MGFLDRLFTKLGGRDSGRDGRSEAGAIVVRSVAEEYAWLDRHYPGRERGIQYVMEKDGKSFDLHSFKDSSGQAQSIYFDISGFYGRH